MSDYEERKPQGQQRAAAAPQIAYIPPLPIPDQAAMQLDLQQRTLERHQQFFATPDVAQRSSVTPVFEAAQVQRSFALQRQQSQLALQRQIEALSEGLPPHALQSALQRQAEQAGVPALPPIFSGPTRSQPSYADHAGRYAHEAVSLQRQADQHSGFVSMSAWPTIQQRAAQDLAQRFRSDTSPAIQRYAELGRSLALVQRQPQGKQVARVVLQRLPAGERPMVQRALDEAESEHQQYGEQDRKALELHALQRKLTEEDALASQAMPRGNGQPLPLAVQRRLAVGLNIPGEHLQTVRVHADPAAHSFAKSVNAIAATVGTDIFFQRGKLDTESAEGQELLAHEVTHTYQQVQGKVTGKGIDPDPGLEQEARDAGKRFASGVQKPMKRSLAAGTQLSARSFPSSVKPAVQRFSLGGAFNWAKGKAKSAVQSTEHAAQAARRAAQQAVRATERAAKRTAKAGAEAVHKADAFMQKAHRIAAQVGRNAVKEAVKARQAVNAKAKQFAAGVHAVTAQAGQLAGKARHLAAHATKTAFKEASSYGRHITGGARRLARDVRQYASSTARQAVSHARSYWHGVSSKGAALLSRAKQGVGDAWNSAKRGAANKYSALKRDARSLWRGAKQGGARFVKLAAKKRRQFARKAKRFAKQAAHTVKTRALAVGKGIASAVKHPGELAKSAWKFAGTQRKRFSAWYATPEGKAAFWKGVTLVAVGALTVASAGTLTLPALAAAGAISAAGGVAATMVGNKVYNAAAANKAKNDPTYTYQARSTFEGVSPGSIALDAAVGAFGGPVMKFAGNLAAKSALGVVKLIPGVAKGGGYLLAAPLRAGGKFAGRGLARITPGVLKDGARFVGRGLRFVGSGVRGAGRWVYGGGRTAVGKLGRGLSSGARKVWNAGSVRGVRRFARNTPGRLKGWARDTNVVKALKQLARSSNQKDKALLNALRSKLKNNAVGRGMGAANSWAKRQSLKASALSNNARTRAEDWVVSKASRMGERVKAARMTKLLSARYRTVQERVNAYITQNPDGYVTKGLVEFQKVGQQARQHFAELWTKETGELGKGMGKAYGPYGKAQTQMKELIGETPAWKKAVEERLKIETEREREKAFARALRERSLNDTPANRTRPAVLQGVEEIMGTRTAALTTRAETYTARHASRSMQDTTVGKLIAKESAEGREKLWGEQYKQRGLFGRAVGAAGYPLRQATEERGHNLSEFLKSMREDGLLSTLSAKYAESATESGSTLIQTDLKARLKKLYTASDSTTAPEKPLWKEWLEGTQEQFKEDNGLDWNKVPEDLKDNSPAKYFSEEGQ